MIGSPLYEIFSKLSLSERKELSKWVRSPIHNPSQDVVRLFDYLDKRAKINEQSLISTARAEATTREKAFAYIFWQNVAYDANKLRDIMSALLGCIEQFLIYKELENNPIEKKIKLCRALRKRGLENRFEKTVSNTYKALEEQPHRNAQYHWQAAQILFEQHEYEHQKDRTGPSPLKKASEELNNYFISESLRQACFMLAHSNVSKYQYEQPFLAPILAAIASDLTAIASDNIEHPPSVLAHYYAYRVASDATPDDIRIENFEQLKNYLFDSSKSAYFSEWDLQQLYITACNFCAKRQNGDDTTFTRHLFDLFQFGDDHDFLLENGSMQPSAFLYAVTAALKIGELAWAEAFISKRQKQLLPDKAEIVTRICQTALAFDSKDVQKAYKILGTLVLRNEDFYYNCHARVLRVCIEFELQKDYDVIDATLTNFSAYLYQHDEAGYARLNYQNFVRFAQQLNNLDPNDKTKTKHTALKMQIEETPQLARKKWLLEKINDLIVKKF